MDEFVFPEPQTPSAVKKSRTGKPGGDAVHHAEFRELENQCRRLVVERSILLKDVSCKDGELKKMTFKLQSLLKIKTNLQSTIAGLEKEMKDVRKSNNILKAKNGILENTGMKKNKIQVDLANARGLLVSKDHDIADLKSEIIKLKVELKNKAEEENSALKVISVKHVEESEAASEALANLKTNQEKLLIQQDMKTKKMLELQSEFENTQERYASSLECSESLQSYKDTLNDRVSLLKAHNFELENQCDSYLKAVSTLEHQIGILCQEKKATEDTLYDALKDADSLRQELTLFKEFEIKMNADQLRLEERRNEDETRHRAEIESATLSLDAAKKEHEDFEKAIREKQEILEKEIENLQKGNRENAERIETLEKENENLQKTNEGDRERIESLEKEHENVQKTNRETVERLAEELQSLRSTIEAVTLEKENLRTEIERISEINRSLEEENWAKSETIDDGKNLISELRRTHSELERISRKKDEELDIREEKFEKCQQDVEDVKWQLQEANENCVNLREKFGDLESMFTARENELNILNTRNAELFKLLKDKDEMLTETYEKMRKVEDELVEKHLVFESLLAKTRDVEDSLDAEITANNCKEQSLNTISAERNILMEEVKQTSEKVLAREREIDRMNEKMDALTKDNCALEQEISEFKHTITDNEKRMNELTKHSLSVQNDFSCRVLELESRLSHEEAAIAELEKENEEAQTLNEKLVVRSQRLEKQVAEKEEKLREMFKIKNDLDKMADSYTQQQKCIVEQRSEISEIRESNVWMKNELDKYKASLEWYEKRKDGWLQELSSAEKRFAAEMEEKAKWKKMFVDLQAKVEPFQAQLDMFEAEKNALLCDKSDANKEVNKMSKRYAELLGHQNHKQKINHVIKLKEENLDLRKDVSKSREQNLKLQKKVERLESQLNAGKRRFDPSKAFSHTDKENYPLHDTN